MPTAPDITTIAGLIGDRARATILMALMAGRPLTATELARAAGITKQTASSHLSKLVKGQLVAVESAGRHRYFRPADHDVGALIESLIRLAHRRGAMPLQSGGPDTALRKAPVCYDHLAGELGVLVFDSLMQRGFLQTAGKSPALTEAGERFFRGQTVDVPALKRQRRPLCLACLDWSVRRHHLAGALGAAILDRCFALGWARPQKGTRALAFSASGERSLRARFSYREG